MPAALRSAIEADRVEHDLDHDRADHRLDCATTGELVTSESSPSPPVLRGEGA
jgi:hypothetical protein